MERYLYSFASTPARNDLAPKLGKAFANWRPSQASTPAAKPFDMQANSRIMRATYPIFAMPSPEMPSPEIGANDCFGFASPTSSIEIKQ